MKRSFFVIVQFQNCLTFGSLIMNRVAYKVTMDQEQKEIPISFTTLLSDILSALNLPEPLFQQHFNKVNGCYTTYIRITPQKDGPSIKIKGKTRKDLKFATQTSVMFAIEKLKEFHSFEVVYYNLGAFRKERKKRRTTVIAKVHEETVCKIFKEALDEVSVQYQKLRAELEEIKKAKQ